MRYGVKRNFFFFGIFLFSIANLGADTSVPVIKSEYSGEMISSVDQAPLENALVADPSKGEGLDQINNTTTASRDTTTRRESEQSKIQNPKSETKRDATATRETELLVEKDSSVMVLIPAGDFWMGIEGSTHHDSRLHKVYLDAFYIDRCEVTNEQYERFLKETGQRGPPYWRDPRFNKPRLPVVGVTWDDAVAYAKWAGKRLPTEAEWEKAARGGLEAKRFPWGDEADNNKEFANSYTMITTPVATYRPNGFGLFDMAGNVWEWTADWYDIDYYKSSPPANPVGPVNGRWRVVRGGAFTTGGDTMECGHRYYYEPNRSHFFLGFRCAKDIE